MSIIDSVRRIGEQIDKEEKLKQKQENNKGNR